MKHGGSFQFVFCEGLPGGKWGHGFPNNLEQLAAILMYPLDWLKIFTGNHGFSPWEIYRFRKHRSAAWVMARLVAHFREDLGCPAGKKSNKWGLHQAN
jgi:hypothetical protein